MIRYIGFCGKAGSGKTTSCDLLMDIHVCGPAITIPWAESLKRIAKIEFGWDGNKDEKGRKLLQILGTECGRMYGGDHFWIDKWQKKADDILNTVPQSIILNDDTRFDNEAERIKDNGGVMIEMYGRESDLGSNSSHSSELGIDSKFIDFRIDNSGSIDDLKSQLVDMYEKIDV